MREDVDRDKYTNGSDSISYNHSDSIYYKSRKLKEEFENSDNLENISYLKDNYGDYSQSRIDFLGVKPNSKTLHGELKRRKDKNSSIPSSLNLQKCFDYIDVMDRVKKEIYLNQKRAEILGRPASEKEGSRSVKKKLFETFKRVR
jgi:hypothetical protein